MKIPENYLEQLKKRKEQNKFTSERQELVQKFVDRINSDRLGTKWKPVTWRHVNGMMAHLKLYDIKWFFGNCEDAQNFSKCFFGILKLNKKVTATVTPSVIEKPKIKKILKKKKPAI